MNSPLETGLKNWLATLLSATEEEYGTGAEATTATTFYIDAVAVILTRHKTGTIAPELLPLVIVEILGTESDVGPLHYSALILRVQTPLKVDGITEVTHEAIVAALRGAFIDGNIPALTAALTTAAGCTCDGFKYRGTQDAIFQATWQSELSFTLGISVN